MTRTFSSADDFFGNDPSVRVRPIWRDRKTGRWTRLDPVLVALRRLFAPRSQLRPGCAPARRRVLRQADRPAARGDPDEPHDHRVARHLGGRVSLRLVPALNPRRGRATLLRRRRP